MIKLDAPRDAEIKKKPEKIYRVGGWVQHWGKIAAKRGKGSKSIRSHLQKYLETEGREVRGAEKTTLDWGWHK